MGKGLLVLAYGGRRDIALRLVNALATLARSGGDLVAPAQLCAVELGAAGRGNGTGAPQLAEVPAVFFALRFLLPGVPRRDFVVDVLDGLSDTERAQGPACAATTTSVALSSPSLGRTIATLLTAFEPSAYPRIWSVVRHHRAHRPGRGAQMWASGPRCTARCAVQRRKSLLELARTRADLGGGRFEAWTGSGPYVLAGSTDPL